MSSFTLLLVLLSAISHASWNLAGKKANPSLGYFWLASLWGLLLGLPLVLPFTHTLLLAMTPEIWAWVLLSGLCQGIYLWALAEAYRRGELSALYPLIRSSPLILLLLGSLLLGSAERISGGAMLGIVLIVGGCFFLPMQRFSELRLSHYLNAATGFALLAATATAGYSLIDDLATKAMRARPGITLNNAWVALLYVVLQAGSAALWLGIALLAPQQRQHWPQLRGQLRSSLFTGVMMLLTYALVVWAMATARDVSYVVAFRQVSIPITVALGITLLGERLTPPKLAGVGIVVIGLLLVVLN